MQELWEIASILKGRGWMLATAESCTGGLLAGRLTDVPGASEWFAGGVVSYATRIKRELLSVDASLLGEHGAVSRPVAEAMAAGVCTRLGVACGVSTTGVAGPSGGTHATPVGTVYVGVCVDGQVFSRRYELGAGSRSHIRTEACSEAVRYVARCMRQFETP